MGSSSARERVLNSRAEKIQGRAYNLKGKERARGLNRSYKADGLKRAKENRSNAREFLKKTQNNAREFSEGQNGGGDN